MKAIYNVSSYDFSNYHESRFLIFDDTIRESGEMSGYEAAKERYDIQHELDAKGGLLLPGLLICHTHIYSAFARGMSVPFNPTNFVELLEQLWWKLDSALDCERTYYSARICADSFLKNGVTGIIDHHASGKEIGGTLAMLKKAVVDDASMRGMFCFETSDRFDVEACIEENTSFANEHAQEKCSSHFGLHASMTLSDETLKKVKNSLDDLPIHIHAAESKMDQDDAGEKYNTTVIERLHKFGLLNPNSLIVHGAYLSEKEMDLIAQNGCYLVLNPSSNMNNGVGLPDYRTLKKHGVNCLLGNDGINLSVASEWQSLLFSMHHRYQDPLAFGLDDLHAIITNGYKYFNTLLGTKLGSLENGANADFILLDEKNPTPIDSSNALGHLFFGYSSSLKPSHVWTEGELKVENYALCNADEKVYTKSRELAQALWNEITEGK